jgi:hypothetical protein
MTSLPSTRTSYVAHRDGKEPAADDPLLDFVPVPHKAPRRNSIGPARQRKFIAALAATGIVREAALAIGASLEALYKLRQRPGAEGFRAAWDVAVDRGVTRLESCALARAIEGEERMVVSGGKLLGFETRHNDSLVMFFLKHRRPDRYGAEKELTLKPGHPLYERVKAEVLKKDQEDEAATLASIDLWLEGMRQRRLANEAILLEEQEREKAEEADDGAPGAEQGEGPRAGPDAD